MPHGGVPAPQGCPQSVGDTTEGGGEVSLSLLLEAVERRALRGGPRPALLLLLLPLLHALPDDSLGGGTQDVRNPKSEGFLGGEGSRGGDTHPLLLVGHLPLAPQQAPGGAAALRPPPRLELALGLGVKTLEKGGETDNKRARG